MGNYLQMAKRQQVLALLDLGWSFRRIETETGVRRETITRYHAALAAKAARVFAGSGTTRPWATAAAYRATIQEKLDAGLSVQRIWQDLVEEFGYSASYESVKRYARTLTPTKRAVGVYHHAPGAEAQVDFFRGAPTLDATTGEWRRPWVFRMTCCHPRHGYKEAVDDQKA